MSKLVFAIPDAESPGWLRRQRQAVAFAQRASADMTPETLDELVAFLAVYVKEPVGPDEAREALFDATQNQIMGLLAAIAGGANERPLSVPPTDKS